jgi:hypothetical protein
MLALPVRDVLPLACWRRPALPPTETKLDCPFRAKLELTAPMDDGLVHVGMPIDGSFTEIGKLPQAQLRGHRMREKKSWFGFGASATVQIWGKPVLDKQNQILRLADLAVAVISGAAFVLLSAAAKAVIPFVWRTLAEHAVIDLKPFAADARKKIGEALADFKRDRRVRVDAAVTDVRLTGIAFDSHTLPVITEAEGNAKVAVSRLPKF